MRILSLITIIAIFSITALAQQKLKTGQDAPDFATQSISGQPVSLSDMEGKVVLVTFWSTKCAICHNEIPKLNQMAERYRDKKDVVFLAMTMDNNGLIEPYLKKNPFSFDIVPDSFGIVLKYADMDASGRMQMGYPAYFLIGKTGKIELRDGGWDKSPKIDSQISKLLQH